MRIDVDPASFVGPAAPRQTESPDCPASHTNIAVRQFVSELVSVYPRFEKQAYAKFDTGLFIQIIMKV